VRKDFLSYSIGSVGYPHCDVGQVWRVVEAVSVSDMIWPGRGLRTYSLNPSLGVETSMMPRLVVASGPWLADGDERCERRR
jgi:hypothetical protein